VSYFEKRSLRENSHNIKFVNGVEIKSFYYTNEKFPVKRSSFLFYFFLLMINLHTVLHYKETIFYNKISVLLSLENRIYCYRVESFIPSLCYKKT